MPGVACTITPISAFQSTNLSSKIDCFNRLAERVLRSLGYPLITVELHQDQIYENIAIACELFTNYAGFTKEYLVFYSSLYERYKGIRLDKLYTLAASSILNTVDEKIDHHDKPFAAESFYINRPDSIFVCMSGIPASAFTTSYDLSGTKLAVDGLQKYQLLDYMTYHTMLTAITGYTLSAHFTESRPPTLALNCDEPNTLGNGKSTEQRYNNMFDYDVMDYRKVIAITDFEEGSSSGINTLFTIEQTLAQQTYFSYAMGNYGFDLVSWQCVKEWMDMREKMLATRRSIEFDHRTQYMRIYPQPTPQVQFYGVVSCWVERPLRDIIKEPWIYQYVLALCKITLARVRGKFGTITLPGGGTMNYTELLQEGLADKKDLEQKLYEGASPGLGSQDPAMWVIG